MPQLVQGHARFTAADFLLEEYQAKVVEKYQKETYDNLVKILHTSSQQMALMKDAQVVELFDTSQNIKRLLTESLAVMTTLAQREGFALAELI
jgi:hypothetical protein